MGERLLRVSLTEQRLDLIDGQAVVQSYSVSTSKHGAGEQAGSLKTPRGRHIVRAKIGDGQPLGSVFVGRRPTGEIHSEALARATPDRDWVLSRILWLSGTEIGKNRLGSVDSMRRYIYIHGTPDSEPLGEPRSIGCIRMSNADVVELFDLVAVGTPVEITE
jgi:lipoprotein-anchoring transpeptidase ErfK/SrfK